MTLAEVSEGGLFKIVSGGEVEIYTEMKHEKGGSHLGKKVRIIDEKIVVSGAFTGFTNSFSDCAQWRLLI